MNTQRPFPRVEDFKTRGRRLKVIGEKFKKDGGGNFFTQRVVHIWSKLTKKTIEADRILTFKRYFDRYMDRKVQRGMG